MSIIMLTSFISAVSLSILFQKFVFRKRNYIKERLEKYTSNDLEKSRQEEDPLSKPFGERVVRPVLAAVSSFVSRLTPAKSREKLQRALKQAGNPGNLKPQEFQTLYYLFLAVLVPGVFILTRLIGKTLGEQLVLVCLAWIIVQLGAKSLLEYYTRHRRQEIQKALPDSLDLLCVSVEAGLGFDPALHHVAEKLQGVLSAEFRTALREMQMGKPRREALKDLSERCGVDDLTTFVGAVIHAEQLGVSIANVLRVQAQQVRTKRRQRVEEKAMKAPVKMLIPLVFCIFPAIFIVLLGPAILKVFEIF